MTLSEELLEILACPSCKGPLDYREEQDELRCPSCRLAFPIEDGIPVMLLEEARPLE